MLRRVSANGTNASQIVFTPTGDLSSKTVQTAIVEALADAYTYADQVASGLDPKAAVKVATDAVLPGTVSYATLNEINSDAALGVIDGTYTPVNGDRILVKNQVASQYNGIYVVTSAAAPFKLTRSSDCDNTPGIEVTSGLYTFALYGAHAAVAWVLLASNPIIINVTPLPFDILCMADAAGVVNTPSGNIAATTVQAAIDELDAEKVAANVAIAGATNTKITYDAKGLVTAGAAATTADIADSTDKRYVSDAQLVVIGNTSGTNTGNQDLSGLAPLAGATFTGAVTFGPRIVETPTALTSTGSSIAIDLALGNNFTHALTESTTLAAPSNPVAGQEIKIVLTQHASSPKTLAYNSFWKFPLGVVPSLTATNSAVDLFVAYVESASRATCRLLPDVK